MKIKMERGGRVEDEERRMDGGMGEKEVKEVKEKKNGY